ncbi:MAG: hypothetical protein AAGA48_00460 [Myxococcota bacterium]
MRRWGALVGLTAFAAVLGVGTSIPTPVGACSPVPCPTDLREAILEDVQPAPGSDVEGPVPEVPEVIILQGDFDGTPVSVWSDVWAYSLTPEVP